MRNVWRAAAVIGMGVLAAGIAACGQSSMGSGGDSGRQVTVFENFTAQDLDGNPVDESIFQGYDVTMINLWGTFCGPCLQEMPDLGELADEYGFESTCDLIDMFLAYTPKRVRLEQLVAQFLEETPQPSGDYDGDVPF